jgi:hypothetical protein
MSDSLPVDVTEGNIAENQFGDFIKHSEFESRTKESLITPNNVDYMFEYDHDIVCLYKQRKQEFQDIFAKARESYIEGDWINCSTALSMALQYS